jgi:cell division protein FtsQ
MKKIRPNRPKRAASSPSVWRVLSRLARPLVWGSGLALLGWGVVVTYREIAPLTRAWFQIQEVTVTGTAQVSRAEVLEHLALTSEDTLLSVSASGLAERLESHPWIKHAEISRAFPHTLAVAVTERQPAAVLRGPSLLLLLDEEGQVLSVLRSGEEMDLPLLTGMNASRLITGEAQARQEAQAGIRLAAIVGQDLPGRPELDWSDPANVTATVNGVRFQFGQSGFGEKWERYRKLQPVLRPPTARGWTDGRREIDLRFRNKVIVRERG